MTKTFNKDELRTIANALYCFSDKDASDLAKVFEVCIKELIEGQKMQCSITCMQTGEK